MAEFLRPDGLISAGSWTGNHTALDEALPSDADRAYSQNNPNGSIFEVSLSNPSGTPGSGTFTVRYRHGQVNNGTLSGTGTATALDVSIVQGTTVIASDAQQAPSGAYATRTWAPDLSGISDWADVRFRAVATGGGGSPANRRGVAISWVEVEVPDPAAPPTDFTIPNMATGTPTLGTPAFASIHALTIAALAAGAPTLGQPAFAQVHALSIGELVAGTPVLGNPALAEAGATALEPVSLDAGTPTLGNPALSQVHALSIAGIDAGTPTLGTPTFSQIHGFGMAALETAVPVLGSPAISQVHALTIAGLSTGTPVLGRPQLGPPGSSPGVPSPECCRRCQRLRVTARLSLR